MIDHVSAHRATAVWPFPSTHPRWESVFQRQYAAYLNLIELWLKVLRPLARKD